MKAVSNAYKKSMARQLRDNSFAVVYFGNIDAEAAEDGVWSSNGAEAYSEFDTVDYRYAYGDTVATLEWNRWTLDGGQMILPSGSVNDGYVSNKLSDEIGSFATMPSIVREFTNTHMFPGLTISFDTRTEEWPLSVTVVFSLNGSAVYTNTVSVLESVLSLETNVDEADRIEIYFQSALPYRRPRVQYVIYGIGREYNNDDLVTITQSNDVDPLSRRLPNERFTFTIFDYEHNYDPDNPAGIYRFVEINSPVSVKYGYTLPDGTVEWLKEDNYLLDSQPKVANNQATFSATGLIGSMTDIYYKSQLGRKSFYDMAEDVLLDANLTLTEKGEHPWEIDNTLKDMYTTAVLPITTHMNCLQMIAHACRCCLYTDDDNVIHIEPFGVTVAGIFSGEFTDNGHESYSEWDSVSGGNSAEITYATLEWNRWELGTDSEQVILPDGGATAQTGYVSSQISDADGNFATNPVFTRSFDVRNDLPIVGFVFDDAAGEHPTALAVKYFNRDEVIDAKTADNVNAVDYIVTSSEAVKCSSIEVTISKALPYHRARVTKVYFKQTDFSLTFDSINIGTQSVSKIDELKNVTVAKSIYTPSDTESKLYEATTDETNLHIEFTSLADNLTVTLSSGTVSSVAAYGRAIDLVVSEGEKTITVTGNVINESTAVKTYSISNTGETDAETNPLITDDDMRDALAQHVAQYLQMRNTYDVEYRGNPELETRDVIGYQTAYTDEFYALVLTDEITFNGALHGKLKVKGLLTNTEQDNIRIIVRALPAIGGNVTGGGLYYAGESVTITATPNNHYAFLGWEENGEVITTEREYTFVVRSQIRGFTAVFDLMDYSVSLYASPASGGTVTGGGIYRYGQTVNISATANEGYTFRGWEENGEIISTAASLSFTAEEDRTLTAAFTINTYTVSATVTPEGAGSVTAVGTYDYGTEVTLTAVPATGYRFSYWEEVATVRAKKIAPKKLMLASSEPDLTSPTITFIVTGDKNYIAHFEQIQCEITANASLPDGGTVTGAGTFTYGQTVTLRVIVNEGYRFIGWTENGETVSTNAVYSFTATDNRTLTASLLSLDLFTVNVYASPAAGGTVSGAGAFYDGASVTVTAAASTGYDFSAWQENGQTVSSSASYTFDITANRSLTAVFTKKPYTISASVSPGAGGTVSGAGTYEYGDSVTMTATAATGYTFTRWEENGSSIGTNASLSFTAESNRTLTAVFTINTYTVTLSASPSDGGSVSGAGSYTHGTSVTVRATAGDTYDFSEWRSSGSSSETVSVSAAYTFTITGNMVLEAVFEKKTYVISASASPSAGGSVSGAGTYEHGDTVTLTATAATGYDFTRWEEGGSSVSTNAAYSFTATAARTLTAVFTKKSYTISASASPSGGGTITGAGSYGYGDTVTLRATPTEDYQFVRWTENGTEVSTNTTYSFTATAARTLVAEFKEYFTISVSVSPSGYGTVTGGGTYESGDTVTLTATATGDNEFVGWKESGSTVSSSTTYSFTASASRTLVAVFQEHSAEIVYYGTATELSVGRSSLAGASVGNYALAMGGMTLTSEERSAVVDAYNTNLTRSTPTTLSKGVMYPASASVGNYAFAMGGQVRSTTKASSDVVNAYNANLSRSIPSVLSVARIYTVGASVGNYAIAAGGSDDSSNQLTTVDAYNQNLVRSIPTALSEKRFRAVAASNNNYALIMAGSGKTVVDAYSTNLTRSTPAALSAKRTVLAAASVGNYVLAMGGYYTISYTTVDVYNENLTKITPSPIALSVARLALVGVSFGNYALAMGGQKTNSSDPVNTVDAFDANLTRKIPTGMSVVHTDLAGAVVGSYALAMGGAGRNKVVDIYTIE